MNKPQDLKSTRISKGLRLEDLASGMLRTATLSEIEQGKRLPRQKTRLQIESLIGPVDWKATFVQDKEHVLFFLREFVNPNEPGALDRVRFAKKALTMIQETL